MDWVRYLLNEFVDNFLEAQDLGKEFHYSWILLLLTMILWKPPPSHKNDATCSQSFQAPKFLTLQYNKDKQIEATTNKSFQ
jgi:hypothetical protein